jgi:hypothetical protein
LCIRDSRDAGRALGQRRDAAIARHRVRERDDCGGVEVAVRREQVVPDLQPRLGAAASHAEDLDAEETWELPLADPCKGLRVYLPATEETYFATAVIWASVSVPLNAGMMPPPTSTWCLARANGGFSASRLGPCVPFVPASASV